MIHSESIPYIQTFRHFRHMFFGLVQPQGPPQDFSPARREWTPGAWTAASALGQSTEGLRRWPGRVGEAACECWGEVPWDGQGGWRGWDGQGFYEKSILIWRKKHDPHFYAWIMLNPRFFGSVVLGSPNFRICVGWKRSVSQVRRFLLLLGWSCPHFWSVHVGYLVVVGCCWFIRHSTGAFWSHGLRCIYGICIPVNFDDPGSLIAHALLSDRAQEQMAAQWRLLPGGKPCCPLGTSCLRSLPKVLSQRTSKLGGSVSERANQLVPNAPNLSRKELHAKTSKLLKPLSSLSVPGELPGHAQAAADWEGQGLREVLTGATFKEVKVPEMVGMCWDRVTSRVVSSRTFLSFVWWRL